MKGRNDLLLALKREEQNEITLKKKKKNASGDALKVLQTDIGMASQRVACLDGQLKEVTERLFKEFETFKKTKAEELKRLLIEFGKIQAEFHSKMSKKMG